MFPDKVDFRFGSGQTVCTAYRASGYTCDWTSSVTQQQTNTAYAIAWFGAYPVQIGSSNKLTVTVAGGGNPTGGGTQPDQPPAGFSRCASENSTCSFSGTAEVVYGAQTSFTAPRQFTGGVACNNSVFTDPIPGPTKSCYQRAVAVVPPVPPVLPGSFTTRVLRTLGLAMNYNIPTGNVVFLWAVDGTDDQKWEFIRQSGSGDNTVYQIRRYGTGSCLNGYAPGQLSTVNTYSCSSTDGDQLWNVIFAPGSNKRLIRQVDRGVGLWCLNAFSPVQNRGLTLYSCDLNDADQQFIFPDLP